MRRVAVLNNDRVPLMPCHPARARQLLKNGKAAVFKQYPFTIIMKEPTLDEKQDIELKVDPGSKVSGISLVAGFKNSKQVIWASNLEHRGSIVKKHLEQRRGIRRSRRNRKTRYRPPRFLNRYKPKGWLPPSLLSRVDNLKHWGQRLSKLFPLTSIAVETVRFDTQKMDNPEISGIEYQQGTLFGYEIREYLLEKWGRKCAYCGKSDRPLTIDHIIPKSRGGSDRLTNLVIACGGKKNYCNDKKGKKTAAEFGFPNIQEKANKTVNQKDIAAVNATRYAAGRALKELNLPITFWSGGRTKMNRIKQGYKKDHWIDAACVGETGETVYIPNNMKPLKIKATGRGIRQFCKVDKYGFPRTKPKPRSKDFFGFKTGDIVVAVNKKGKYKGKHSGKVAVRSSGTFDILTGDGKVGTSWKRCKILQKMDGYSYS